VCRKHGISPAAFYKDKARFGGMDVSEAQRLKAPEDENAKLKKLLAEAMLDLAVLKDVAAKKMVTPDAKREAVAHVVAVHGISQRRACEVLAMDRSSIRFRSIRPDDAAERAATKAVAAERRRFGYRRIHIMLDRQGIVMNLKKLRRLYREERLQVRKRGGRKRALGTRRPMVVPHAANARWSVDFVSDAFTDGRRFRVLAVVDDFTRECLYAGRRYVAVRHKGPARTRRGDLQARPPRHHRQRQWHRVHLDRDPVLVPAHGNRLALHRTRLTHPERSHRELQRTISRRVPERSAVHDAARRPHPDRNLEGGLQPPQTPSALGNSPPAEFAMKIRLEKQAA
jgi:putative transposase